MDDESINFKGLDFQVIYCLPLIPYDSQLAKQARLIRSRICSIRERLGLSDGYQQVQYLYSRGKEGSDINVSQNQIKTKQLERPQMESLGFEPEIFLSPKAIVLQTELQTCFAIATCCCLRCTSCCYIVLMLCSFVFWQFGTKSRCRVKIFLS